MVAHVPPCHARPRPKEGWLMQGRPSHGGDDSPADAACLEEPSQRVGYQGRGLDALAIRIHEACRLFCLPALARLDISRHLTIH